MGMVPSYKQTQWEVGARQDTGMVTIRVPDEDDESGFVDYYVPPDQGNADYQQYLEWLAIEGNEPVVLTEEDSLLP